MKKLIVVALISMLLVSPIVFASEGMFLRIKNNSIYVEGFIETSLVGRVPAGIFQKINESLGANVIVCDEVAINQSNVTTIYQQNCTLNIDYSKDISFNFANSSSTIIGDLTLQRNYEDCLVGKSQFEAGLNSCVSTQNEIGDYEDNFTTCSSDLRVCNSEKSTSDSKYSELKIETDESQNNKWLWLGLGAGLGIVGILYRDGKIGGAKVKKPEEKYNTGQSA